MRPIQCDPGKAVRSLAILGLMIATLLGCWQEVEYAGPVDTKQARDSASGNQSAGEPQSQSATGGDEAEQFADDLATSLSQENANELSVAQNDPVDPEPRPSESEYTEGVTGEAPSDRPANDSLFEDLPVDISADDSTEAPSISAAPSDEDLSDFTSPNGAADAARPSEAEPLSEPQSQLPDYDPLFDDPPPPTSASPANIPPSGSDMPADGEVPVAPAEEPDRNAIDSAELPAAEPSTIAESAPTDSASKIRRSAWLLGSKFSLAILAHGRGASGDEVQSLMDQSRAVARLFGITLPELPPRPLGIDPNSIPERALDFLFAQGGVIGKQLASNYGVEVAALFEVAVKSNILLVLYRPNSAAVDAIATAIREAGTRSQLPSELWQPLVALLQQQAPVAEIRAAVYKFHSDTDRHLAEHGERAGGVAPMAP